LKTSAPRSKEEILTELEKTLKRVRQEQLEQAKRNSYFAMLLFYSGYPEIREVNLDGTLWYEVNSELNETNEAGN